jgi:hypothetical protein
MATPTGGQYVFSTASGPVDVFLTPSGPLADPGAGGNAFDLEIFTVTNKGTSDSGFEGSAFVPGGVVNAQGRVAGPSITANNGNFWITDFGGNDTIQAGSGAQTITGGVATKIFGGTGTMNVVTGNLDTVAVGGAASATVNTLGNTGERVDLGTNSATVYSNNNDTINAGAGAGTLVFGTSANLTIQGAAGAPTYTVKSSTADGSISGAAASVNLTALVADTITFGGVTGATVNALNPSAQLVGLGSGNATVYAGAGDAVTAGTGTGLVVFGAAASAPFATITGGFTGSIFIADSTGTLALGAASATVVGAAGDTITAGAGNQLINGVGINATNPGGSINERIVVNQGLDTVWGGSGDTIGVGGSAALSGSDLWLNSSLSGGAVGFGTFNSTGSTANATVGTVSGGAASEGFDSVSGDFFFYPGQNAINVASVIASATSVSVGGVASTQFSLPDGTTLTAIGVTSLSAAMFRPA